MLCFVAPALFGSLIIWVDSGITAQSTPAILPIFIVETEAAKDRSRTWNQLVQPAYLEEWMQRVQEDDFVLVGSPKLGPWGPIAVQVVADNKLGSLARIRLSELLIEQGTRGDVSIGPALVSQIVSAYPGLSQSLAKDNFFLGREGDVQMLAVIAPTMEITIQDHGTSFKVLRDDLMGSILPDSQAKTPPMSPQVLRDAVAANANTSEQLNRLNLTFQIHARVDLGDLEAGLILSEAASIYQDHLAQERRRLSLLTNEYVARQVDPRITSSLSQISGPIRDLPAPLNHNLGNLRGLTEDARVVSAALRLAVSVSLRIPGEPTGIAIRIPLG